MALTGLLTIYLSFCTVWRLCICNITYIFFISKASVTYTLPISEYICTKLFLIFISATKGTSCSNQSQVYLIFPSTICQITNTLTNRLNIICQQMAPKYPQSNSISGSSRPGEFHPQPLTEPYVKLSLHTAPVIQSLRWRIFPMCKQVLVHPINSP